MYTETMTRGDKPRMTTTAIHLVGEVMNSENSLSKEAPCDSRQLTAIIYGSIAK